MSRMSELPTKSLRVGVLVIRATLKTLSSSPGVYRMLDAGDRVLYVGKAKNLKKRVLSYTQVTSLPKRLQQMVALTARMEVILTETEAEALLLEANLIKKLEPRYNIIFRDNKSLPYIVLTDHPFPLLKKHRGMRRESGDYFGPFSSVQMVSDVLNALHRAFLLRSCSDNVFQGRTRPCLEYHIKRCSAPCVNKISEQDYRQLVREARDFLRGKGAPIQKQLQTEMESRSAAQDYEKAAVLRDRIRALTTVQAHQLIHTNAFKDADLLAICTQANQACIQLFFFRDYAHYGSKTFFFLLRTSQRQNSSPPLSSSIIQRSPPLPCYSRI